MSTEWKIKCSCGAETPEDGMNHGEAELAKIVCAREALKAVAELGIEFEVTVYGVARSIDQRWFLEHGAHAWRIESEYGDLFDAVTGKTLYARDLK